VKEIEIMTTTGQTIKFTGKHLPERQSKNWHYYQDDEGAIFCFRKEHMVMVYERDK